MSTGSDGKGPQASDIVRKPRQPAGRWLPLVGVLALGAALRFYGLNWDEGHWLHPDERQIYFVVQGLGWPTSLGEFLSPSSPLNPGFFAYGSLPIYLLKMFAGLLAAAWPALRDPDSLHLAGRTLAVLFDMGAIFLTYRLALAVSGDRQPTNTARSVTAHGQAIFAALLAALSVMSVQLAHFYTVDIVLGFFVMLVLNLTVDVVQSGSGRGRLWSLGIVLGMALATKVSAAPLVLVVALGLYVRAAEESSGSGTRTVLMLALRRAMTVLAVAAISFIAVQPYAAIDWRSYIADVTRESRIAWGQLDVPYTQQFAGTWPFLYSIWQVMLWGLGLPLGAAGWMGVVCGARRYAREGSWTDTLLLAWVLPYLAAVGLMRARYLRYMQPLVPVLCVLAVRMWAGIERRRVRVACGVAVLALTLLYNLAFVSIYSQPHSWVAASEWIYGHVEPGSTLSIEAWDTALPLPLEMGGRSRRLAEYDVRTLNLYDEPDDADKWMQIAGQLSDSDYVILASRRLLGSIPRLPDRYPIGAVYYERLLSGALGFEQVSEFARGGEWWNPRVSPLPGASPAWSWPDESFVVYDHPRALVLRNAERKPAADLLQILTGN